MNPRILKKLSKRVAEHAKALGYKVDLDGPCEADYTPKRASRKPSHRARRRNSSGSVFARGMLTAKRTPYFCWSDYGPDGCEGDSAIAWTHIARIVRDEIDSNARDWSCWSIDSGAYPPYRTGKAPKLPRNTWQMLRAIENKARAQKGRPAGRAAIHCLT